MSSNPSIKKYVGLFFFMMIVFMTAYIGAIASMNAKSFYSELSRPSWAPPAYLFGPVWTVLYIAMAVAVWLVWLKDDFRLFTLPISSFFAQLVLNALWTWIFFHWHLGFFSFVEILALWVLIVITILLFWRKCKISAILLMPYLAWVTFATALTYSIWKANPHILA